MRSAACAALLAACASQPPAIVGDHVLPGSVNIAVPHGAHIVPTNECAYWHLWRARIETPDPAAQCVQSPTRRAAFMRDYFTAALDADGWRIVRDEDLMRREPSATHYERALPNTACTQRLDVFSYPKEPVRNRDISRTPNQMRVFYLHPDPQCPASGAVP